MSFRCPIAEFSLVDAGMTWGFVALAPGQGGQVTVDKFDFNTAKFNFSDVYQLADPSPYFASMRNADYQIPQNALPIFIRLIELLRESRRKSNITIADIGCSYGVNGALLKYDVELAELYDHFRTRELLVDRAAALEFDVNYFANLRERGPITVCGLDSSKPAIDFALRAGLIDVGAALDLETDELYEPTGPLEFRDVDLIISTGCVGYVTTVTFEKILQATNPTNRPPIASSVLRTFDYRPFERCFEEFGLISHHFPLPLKQRNIMSTMEGASTIAALESQGIEPAGLESTGSLYANLYVAAPTQYGSNIKQILSSKSQG
jgi:hypothetical protein